MSAYGAGLLIMRSDGRMLLTRRGPFETSPGYWDAPGGGVEAGETHLQTAIREGREELGGLPKLDIATEPIWWAPSPFFAFATFPAKLDASWEGWEPTLSNEHDAYGWFSPADLPKPMLEGLQHILRQLFGP